jgi:triosephosphate isomerase
MYKGLTIKAGADATGTTSGIMKAKAPEAMLDEMIRAVRMAWDEVHN